MFHGYAANEAGAALAPLEFDPGPLRDDDIEIRVEYCGICHSDLSMLNNEWGMTAYPFVPGHEIVGIVDRVGPLVRNLRVGQRVGVGWYTRACMTCPACISGNQNLCSASEQTIVSRHGGFSDRVRAHHSWAIPLPDTIEPRTAGPLFCGGITVFGPIIEQQVRPIDRVGVIGVGGLGHMAVRFLRSWGCEVTAFSSSPNKEREVRELGAHHFVSSKDTKRLQDLRGYFDFIISTVNVPMDWGTFIDLLAPKGHLHLVGAVLDPIPVQVFSLLMGNKSIGASPLGTPTQVTKMLDFTARHQIAPIVEVFKLSDVNKAFDHLKAGKARYRLVLDCS